MGQNSKKVFLTLSVALNVFMAVHIAFREYTTWERESNNYTDFLVCMDESLGLFLSTGEDEYYYTAAAYSLAIGVITDNVAWETIESRNGGTFSNVFFMMQNFPEHVKPYIPDLQNAIQDILANTKDLNAHEEFYELYKKISNEL